MSRSTESSQVLSASTGSARHNPRVSSRETLRPGDTAQLRHVEIATHLREAARRVLDDCLRVVPSNRVLLVAEPEFEGLAAAILEDAEARDIPLDIMLVTGEEGQSDQLIGRLKVRIERYDRSILICTRALPRKFRSVLTEIGDSERRHAHLLGINDAVFRQGLRADFQEVEAIGEALLKKLDGDVTIEVTGRGGTKLTARPDTSCLWHNQSGILRAPGWTNLPAGELATVPAAVDGVFVPDGGLWLTDGTQIDRAIGSRLTIHLADGHVERVEGPADVVAQLEAHMDGGEYGRRVAQISFGTNVGVLATIGLVAQDAKLPGFHLTLGFTAPQCTNASWCGDLLVNMLQRKASATIDGEPVLKDGRYVSL